MTLISQRPALIHKDVLTQIEVLVVHRLTGPHDRDAIERWVEHHADDDQAREVLASLASLEDGDAWVWSPGWLSLFKRVHIRERTTFDSSSTPRVGERRRTPRVVAKADLDLLRERMAETIERAKADDPRELRRRIDALQAELRVAKAAATRVEIPVLRPGQLEHLTNVAGALIEVVGDFKTVLSRVSVKTNEPEPPTAPPPRPRAEPVRRRSVNGAATHEESSSLRAGERRMLETLVRHHPVRLTRAQLATIAGFTASGGTFGAYLGTLKRNGFVVEESDGLLLTDEGLAAGGGAPARPQTIEEIVETWRRALRSGERRMLDVLIEARPAAVTREELAERSGFEARGGTFGAYLGTLRRNGLADVAGDEVRVGEALFLGSR